MVVMFRKDKMVIKRLSDGEGLPQNVAVKRESESDLEGSRIAYSRLRSFQRRVSYILTATANMGIHDPVLNFYPMVLPSPYLLFIKEVFL